MALYNHARSSAKRRNFSYLECSVAVDFMHGKEGLLPRGRTFHI
jgi:hypothetical protein